MPQSFAHVPIHFIWSTQARRPWIHPDWAGALHGIIGGIAKEHRCKVIAMGGVEDHVHLFLLMCRDKSMSDLVRDIKSRTSQWIHKTQPSLSAFAWQSGYGAFGVDPANHDKLIAYIRDQRAHHRKLTFQEEFLAYLDHHGMEYDLRYLWE